MIKENQPVLVLYRFPDERKVHESWVLAREFGLLVDRIRTKGGCIIKVRPSGSWAGRARRSPA